jgi:hypothetical protein
LLDNGRVERVLESLLAGRHLASGRMALDFHFVRDKEKLEVGFLITRQKTSHTA